MRSHVRDCRSGHPAGTLYAAVGALVAALFVATLPVVGEEPAGGKVPAEAVKVPPVDELMELHIKASGGREAMEKLRNRVTKGTFEMPAAGIKGAFTMYEAAPNKRLMEMELDGIGPVRDGTDGEIAWEISAMQGPRIKEGAERAATMHEAVFNGVLQWKTLYKSVECTGVTEFEGTPCYTIVMTPKEGNAQTAYMDQKSHLVIGSEQIYSHPMGQIPVKSVIGDYRAVDGVQVPHALTQSMMGQTQKLVLESVQHNVDLPAEKFAVPAEITSLIEEEKAEAAAMEAKNKAVNTKED